MADKRGSRSASRTRRRRKQYDDPTKAPFFAEYRSRAREYVRNPDALRKLATSAREKASRSRSSVIQDLLDQIKLVVRMIRAYAKGEYREISTASMVLIVAAILYFVTPVDLIPDAIPGAGYIDDAAVLGFVLARLGEEFERFAAWERDGDSGLGGVASRTGR